MENSIIENKDYLLVHIENAKFNVEGILSKLLDKSYLQYYMFKDRMTLLSPKYSEDSIFAHSLHELIKYADNDGIWYFNTWHRIIGNEPYTGVLDTLFYDEFIFLLSEDLIKFDDIELLTLDDIFRNFNNYIQSEETPFLKSMLNCKNKNDLRKEYRKLVMKYHPDKTGNDNDQIRQITQTYLKLSKNLVANNNG